MTAGPILQSTEPGRAIGDWELLGPPTYTSPAAKVVDLRDFDGVRPWKTSLGAVMVSGQPKLTNTLFPFTSADVGKTVIVNQDGPATRFVAKILSVDPNSHVATLNSNCPSSSGNQRIQWGFDIGPALATAFASLLGTVGVRAELAGFYRASQVIVPAGLEFAGIGWGSTYPVIGTNVPNTTFPGTLIQQIPGTNKDLVIFSGEVDDGAGHKFIGPLKLSDLVLLGPDFDVTPVAVNAGSGLALRNAAGDPLTPQDGFELDSIHAIQFYDDGFLFPAGAIPGHFSNLRGFYNGGYGINFAGGASRNAQAVHFLNPSCDGNGPGGIRVANLDNWASVTITNFKSEKGTSSPLPHSTAGQNQESAIVVEDCDDTPILVNGLTHIASLTTFPATTAGPAILIKNTTNKRPRLRFHGLRNRIYAGQVGNVANAVSVRDQITGIDLAQTVVSASWPPEPSSTYDKDNGQAGIYTVPPGALASGSNVAPANTGRIARIRPSRDMTIVSLVLSVINAATNDDPIDVGIYDATLHKLASSGAVTGKMNALGATPIALSAPYKLLAGQTYYLAWSYGAVGGTAATLTVASTGNAQSAQMFGAAAPQVEYAVMAAAHPLPNVFVPAASAICPYIAAKE